MANRQNVYICAPAWVDNLPSITTINCNIQYCTKYAIIQYCQVHAKYTSMSLS